MAAPESPPIIPALQAGVSYEVHLRATPGYDAHGNARPDAVMWSADLQLSAGISLTASSGSSLGALVDLHDDIVARLAAQG